MKQLLLIFEVVALVGCGKDDPGPKMGSVNTSTSPSAEAGKILSDGEIVRNE